MELISNIEFWKFVTPFVVAVIAWFSNELIKQLNQAHERKEKKYSQLISCIEGFYIDVDPIEGKKLKSDFIKELNQ